MQLLAREDTVHWGTDINTKAKVRNICVCQAVSTAKPVATWYQHCVSHFWWSFSLIYSCEYLIMWRRQRCHIHNTELDHARAIRRWTKRTTMSSSSHQVPWMSCTPKAKISWGLNIHKLKKDFVHCSLANTSLSNEPTPFSLYINIIRHLSKQSFNIKSKSSIFHTICKSRNCPEPWFLKHW